jgi:hypothetical protein
VGLSSAVVCLSIDQLCASDPCVAILRRGRCRQSLPGKFKRGLYCSAPFLARRVPRRDTRCNPTFARIFSNMLSGSQLCCEPKAGPRIAPLGPVARLVELAAEVA